MRSALHPYARPREKSTQVKKSAWDVIHKMAPDASELHVASGVLRPIKRKKKRR